MKGMSLPELKTADILASERTMLASERTLMGWIRTAISMISFGFTIAKALQYAAEQGVVRIRHQSPEYVGLILIILATVSLVLASIQHRSFVRSLPAIGVGRKRLDLALIMASLIITLGLLVLVNIIFRVGPI
jgi:putative membrane protein